MFLIPALWMMFQGFSERWREHGMLRLIPIYQIVWAVAALGGIAGLIAAGRMSDPSDAAAKAAAWAPKIIPGLAVFAAVLVAGAIGVYKRRLWGWWTALCTWAPALLGGVAAAIGGMVQARAGTLPSILMAALPGVGGIILGLIVVRPLWTRRKEFGRKLKAPPSNATPPSGDATPPGRDATPPSGAATPRAESTPRRSRPSSR